MGRESRKSLHRLFRSRRSLIRISRAFPLVVLAGVVGCHSQSTSASDASVAHSVVVHVPGALRVARAIDSLSVEIDSSSRADLEVSVDADMTLGVDTEAHVFAAGESTSQAAARIGHASGGDFDVGVSSWNAVKDGVPQIDKKYEVEMQIVLFEQNDTSPRKILLRRTLRQAEE